MPVKTLLFSMLFFGLNVFASGPACGEFQAQGEPRWMDGELHFLIHVGSLSEINLKVPLDGGAALLGFLGQRIRLKFSIASAIEERVGTITDILSLEPARGHPLIDGKTTDLRQIKAKDCAPTGSKKNSARDR